MADTATKIRIFSLAKELGMDSKVLIEHCRSAGLTVKGSALASISPEEKELVLRHMNGAGGGNSVSPAQAADVPSREDVKREIGSRMRDIRTMVPRERANVPASQEEDTAPVEQLQDDVPGEPAADDQSADDAAVLPVGDETVVASEAPAVARSHCAVKIMYRSMVEADLLFEKCDLAGLRRILTWLPLVRVRRKKKRIVRDLHYQG
jgi:hypothetical protein